MNFLTQLQEKRNSKNELIDATLNRAAEEDRDLNEIEVANVQALALEIEKLEFEIAPQPLHFGESLGVGDGDGSMVGEQSEPKIGRAHV